MTDDDDARWITSLLHGEADRHEPDRARVMARIRDGLGPPAPARTRAPGRWLLPLSIAAAALVVMAGVGTFVVARVGPGIGRPEPVPTSARPAGTVHSTVASSNGKVSVGTATSAPSTSATTGPTPTGASTGAPVAPGSVSIQAQPAASGLPVVLPQAGTRDWVVVGGRQDRVLVRAKAGDRAISGPDLFGNWATAIAPGPYRVSWTGGAPEQDSSTTTWLTVRGAGAGIRISVPAAKGEGALVLYLGSIDATVHLAARLAGGGGTSIDLPGGAGTTGRVVTIRFRASGGTDTLLVDISCDPGGGMGLAAVTLS